MNPFLKYFLILWLGPAGVFFTALLFYRVVMRQITTRSHAWAALEICLKWPWTLYRVYYPEPK